MITKVYCGVILVLITMIFSLIWKHFVLRKVLKSIPGPASIPFIGIILDILKIPREDRLQWFNNLCFKYKSGIVLTWIGIVPMVNIRKPKYIETILSSDELLTKSWIYNLIRPWMGNGLFTAAGDSWAKRRKMLTPTFHSSVLKNYAAIIRDKTKDLIDCIELKVNNNDKALIDVSELISYYSLDSICEAAMGVNMNFQKNAGSEYIKALQTYKRLAYERISRIWLMWDTLYYLTPKGKELKECTDILHDFSKKIIRQRQLQRLETPNCINEIQVDEYGIKNRKAFLDLLLDENEKVQDPLTFLEIREEVDTFIAGGNDTVTATMNWTLFSIGNEPEIQDKIQNELREVLGNQTEIPTITQLTELNYLERVIKEALRLYPIGPTISRCLDKDTNLGPYFLPKNTTVQINIFQLHRDPDVWEDPEKFDPDRFLPENIRMKNQYAYIPFSAGPRACLGQHYAMLEMKTALACILQRWRVSSLLKPSEMKMVVDFTLEPWNGVMMLYFTPLR